MTNEERIQSNNAELLEAIEQAENLPNAGGGDASHMVVTFTTAEDGKLTPSHTYEQITEWVNNGGSVALTNGNTWYKLAFINKSQVWFERTTVTAASSSYTRYIITSLGYMDIIESDSKNINVTATVGQTIIVKEVDENGKPTAWEAVDYQPRTHWSEEGSEDIIKELTFTPVLDEDLGAYLHPLAPFELVEGRTYTVIFDGVSYTCTAFTGELGGLGGIAIGNKVLLGENTGEPFCLGLIGIMLKVTSTGEILQLNRDPMMITFDANEHTVRVTEDKIVPHKIAEEYVTPSVFYVSIGVKNYETDEIVLLTPWDDIIEAVYSGKVIYSRLVEDSYEFDEYGDPHVYRKVSLMPCTEIRVGTNSLVCSLQIMLVSTSGYVSYLVAERDRNGVTTFRTIDS